MNESTSHNLNHQPPAKITPHTDHSHKTSPDTTAAASPSAHDHCLQCNYSLRNLQTWRCPECGFINATNELVKNRLYTRSSLKTALRYTFYPTGGFLAVVFIVLLFLVVVGNMNLDLSTFMFIFFFVALPYILLHLGLLIAGAARLTQAQIMKRKFPEAVIAHPLKAIPLFLLHFSWMSFAPFIILFFLLNWSAYFVAGV